MIEMIPIRLSEKLSSSELSLSSVGEGSCFRRRGFRRSALCDQDLHCHHLSPSSKGGPSSRDREQSRRGQVRLSDLGWDNSDLLSVLRLSLDFLRRLFTVGALSRPVRFSKLVICRLSAWGEFVLYNSNTSNSAPALSPIINIINWIGLSTSGLWFGVWVCWMLTIRRCLVLGGTVRLN